MIILLDCDGVLADLTNYFLAWLALRHDGVKRTEADVRHWDFVEALGIPHHVEDRFWSEVAHCKHCERLPAYEGARAFVAALQQRNHQVWALTASSNAAWTGQRAEWLERRMGIVPRRQIICGKDAKPMVHGDVLIDDSLENVYAWQEAHQDGNAYVFDRPWNQVGGSTTFVREPGVGRFRSYAEALAVLK